MKEFLLMCIIAWPEISLLGAIAGLVFQMQCSKDKVSPLVSVAFGVLAVWCLVAFIAAVLKVLVG